MKSARSPDHPSAGVQDSSRLLSSEPHRIESGYNSPSPGDPRAVTPTTHLHNPLNSSPPAVVGDPANWLLPHPFRHEVELPFVGETSYEEDQETEARFDSPSLSSTASFNERGRGSGASTPISLQRGTPDNSTMRSPYFQSREAMPDSRQAHSSSSSTFDTGIDTSPHRHPFSAAAAIVEDHPSDPFVASESESDTQNQHYQRLEHSADDNNNTYSGAHPSVSYESDTGSLGLSQPATFLTRLASPGSEPESAYGPSVISRPVTQTLTPNMSPYEQEMAPAGVDFQPPANTQPPLRSSSPQRQQDSSILSPLGHVVAPRYPLRPTEPAEHPLVGQPNRAETRGSSLLDLVMSSDPESDSENTDAHYTDRAVRRPNASDALGSHSTPDVPEEQDRVLCAISESRSADMIGMAVINITMGHVDLIRIVNDDRYRRLTETLCRMPTQPQTFLVLKNTVDQHSRSALHWNESEGLKMVDRFAWPKNIKAIHQNLEHNFYVSCAFSAAMAYIEEETEVIFRENSLRVRYQHPADTMGLDRSTITCLELFQNIRNAKGTSSTLFGLLNNTLTPQGRRMIRATLLQPSTSKKKIIACHEAVEELSSKEDLFTELRASLKRLLHIDLERSIPWVALNTGEPRLPLQDGVALIQGRHQIAMPNHEELQGAERDLNHILMVKSYLGGIQAVHETLEAAGCTSRLCKWALGKCGQENIAPVAGLIEGAIEQDAIYSKAPIDIRNNRLWAVKAEPDGILEAARELYRDRTNDMHQYVEGLNKTFQEQLSTTPELRLGNDNHYYLRFQWSDVERELRRQPDGTEDGQTTGLQRLRPRPLGGVQIVNGIRRKQHYDCQTLTLIQRSSQIQRHADIITAQSDRSVVELKKSLLEHSESLIELNEAIAVLDMLCSYAHLATSQNYVRPILSDNLVLKGARHPMIEVRKQNFKANDVYLGDHGARFQVVTGGNMSGKSTYIRSIALIQLMTQIGSFVPAMYAAIPICDRLFTRLSTEDKPETNLGTFAVEMTEMNMILRQVTRNSLVIIDELGRGTSTTEGLAIGLAMSEKLIKAGCRVFFATHFTELARVLNAKKGSNVLNVHVVGESTNNDDTAQISLPHTIAPGPVRNEDYGLDLARRFLPGRQADNSTMDGSALASYFKKLQTEFTIRMNLAADDDTSGGQSSRAVGQTAAPPILEKPSEEELEEWKKKSDTAERRVMHANMAQSQEKKRPASGGESNDESLQKRIRIVEVDDDTWSMASQPTPVNRGSMIEALRRGACTPTTRADTPSSVTTGLPESDVDTVMEDAAPGQEETSVEEALTPDNNRQRAVSISSDSSDYSDMPGLLHADVLPSTSARSGADVSSEPTQPLERFQPLRGWHGISEWNTPEQQAAGESSTSTRSEAHGGLARIRPGTPREFLHGYDEYEEET
ncbi:muts domain V-domain-containing protein [Chaetomidium leptoderma]|uniref:DNA mismatch repair protein MSH3 n=1 Tax=Chaetomidium leptoderma TaxID=669021 RepID=A0AAN6VSR7_9PEZI|nr:muts domain V-domain-containing protein [Chaetomidium leptoderma]